MAGSNKPSNPPQQAGQKRKSDAHGSDLSNLKRQKSGGSNAGKSKETTSAHGKQSGNPHKQQSKAGQGGQQQSGKPNSNGKTGQSKQQGQPSGPKNARQRRGQMIRDARTMATQTTSKAFSNGALDVDKFVKAREFEIRALQEGLQRSKKARMERAFQSVPRDMRRRAGAWDVRKLPKGKGRKDRARREIVEDNTPTGRERRKKLTREARVRGETVKRLRALGDKRRREKEKGKVVVRVIKDGEGGGKSEAEVKTKNVRVKKNRLRDPPVPKARFKKRQLNKTWLPTHMFHAKRAHMSPPMEPIWRFALPLTPTAKSYRPTHRAVSERGAVAWDVSYTSTIGLEGKEESLLNLLRALGVDEAMLTRRKGELWRVGRRSWQGWTFSRDSSSQKAIAPVTVIWQVIDPRALERLKLPTELSWTHPRRKLVLRVHPSAFHHLWEEVVRLCRVQKPEVKAEDLRFEIGSIEITGPGSTEALQGALWSAPPPSSPDDLEPAGKLWQSLRGLDNPASLPANSTLAMKVSDPRLHHPPRTIAPTSDLSALLQTLATFDANLPLIPASIFDSRTRRASVAAMQSQKAINRRKSASDPGTYPSPLPTDPAIPTLLYTTSTPAPRGTSPSQQSASWTVLLPWKCVAAVWQSLMYYPLSSGGQVRFGGQREQRQLAFEKCSPWFPGDFPGTEAGDAWVERESEERKKAWERRPRSRRVNFEGLELGNGEVGERGEGWGCPWGLVLGAERADEQGGEAMQVDETEVETGADKGGEEDGTVKTMDVKPWHCPSPLARALLKPKTTPAVPTAADAMDVDAAAPAKSSTSSALTHAEANVSTALITVCLTYLGRGTPDPAARIYRLPTSDLDLRARWLAVYSELSNKKKKEFKRPPNRLLPEPGNDRDRTDIKKLARELVGLDADEDGESERRPPVPKEEDLIGFVTSGGFNLREGKGTAVGSLGLARVRDAWSKDGDGNEKLRHICIVRNAGETVGRLARWEVV